MTTEFWRRWLLLASGLIAAYAASLVLAGAVTGRLFDVLGFGMQSGAVPDGQPRSYVLFIYGVLGAVLTGWMITLAGIAAGPMRTGEPWAWPVLAASLGTWFVLDTGLSLAVGYWQHAVFNVFFLACLGLPLAGWRSASKESAECPNQRHHSQQT
ncbi:MAG TPA: hypothetical protein VLL08_22660 [Kineosporiaceae bacterium]|nr:hypothetical protein [Kineosporiaceae bacterium]